MVDSLRLITLEKKKETTNNRSLVKEIMQITVIYMPGIRNPGQFFNSKYLKLF